MAYLDASQLSAVCPNMSDITPVSVTTFLARANSYAIGVIGGILPESAYDESLPKDGLLAAVGLAFEIMATGESSAADPTTGNITALGPDGFFVQKKPDPLATVDRMLRPYKNKYEAVNASAPDRERGIRFF